MEQQMKHILDFYLLATQLKEKIRSGWKQWHIQKERVESVAEHIYGTCMLAIAIDSEMKIEIDLEKVIMMLVIHELEEIKIGDLTPFDKISKEEKRNMGKEAVENILKELNKGEKYQLLIEEFEEMKTKEAIFCKMCDKLEADIQSKLYEENGYIDIHCSENKERMQDKRIQKMIEQGANTLSEFFIENDRSMFVEKEFQELANYIENHKLVNKGE